jgi:hypothetical protein
MKHALKILLITLIGISSCTEPYDDAAHSDKQILVVGGFLGNKAGDSYVSLSLATSYDASGVPTKVNNAAVYITDNTDSVFMFREYSSGYYRPVDTSFAGRINKIYTLTVKTADGQEYVSQPETMLPVITPSKAYAGYNQIEELIQNENGASFLNVKDVTELYLDYDGEGEATPRFRYTTSHLVEYIIDKLLNPPAGGVFGYTFYCWITGVDNSLRFTNEKYASNTGKITKQVASVVTADKVLEVPDMSTDSLTYADTLIKVPEYKRIIRVHQYRLNTDSYNWYKGVESQSSAEGRIFDPLTAQLKGNISCKTDPDRTVLGFFEVSLISDFAYALTRDVPGGEIVVTQVPDIFPDTKGFTIDTAPGFWIW